MPETSLARYFQQSGRPAVLTPLSVADTGAEQIGMAISQLGTTIDGIAQRDEQFWVQREMADIDGYTRNLWDTSINNATDGADGFETGYLSSLDQRYEQARGNAPSPRALRALESEILNHRTQQAAAAQGFATEEKYQFRRDTILNDADNFGQEVYRFPGVPAYEPTGSLVPPGLTPGTVPNTAGGYFSTGTVLGSGETLPNNIAEWQSKYYSPRDFADGANMADRSGAVVIGKQQLAALDWVTDQFGYGKLQINSGYRSPESNVARASSGPEGPHTHGQAMDIQVRDLPQAEKNRLYSLFKASGANAFGFGDGVLHVEWRDGTGKGRNGDFEWTYGSSAKYDLVPVAGPSVAGGAQSTANMSWETPNQYPYLPVVAMTARSETGTTDLATASLTISREADGTLSYGALGLNSAGIMGAFVREYGEKFGLTATMGTPEFNAQWEAAVKADPQGVVDAQLKFHAEHIVGPAQVALVSAGVTNVANDPRVVAFASDMVTQYGAAIARERLKAGAGATNASAFINAVSEDARRNLDTDFQTALASDPNIRTGLLNRIDNRARDSMSVMAGSGAMATGNVPAWDGPIPNIEDLPGYADRMRRLEAMIDTMGGTPDQRRDLKRQMRANVTRAWLSRVAEVNPPAAMAALMSGRYDEDLTLTDTGELVGSTESAYRAFETEIRNRQKELIANLKTEAETLLGDEIASVQNTGQSLGKLTDSHLAVLSDADKADLSFAQFQYETTREIANAATSELPGILEGLTPSGDGFAEEQKRYNFALEQVKARLEAQANDPAGYAVSSSEQLSTLWRDAIASNDPAQVSSAIKAIRAAQRRLGVTESNITTIPQASMTQNEELLSNAENADEAFATFMQMRGLFGDEFGNVIRDMEGAGLAKGWGAVNDMVTSGNVLLAKSLARVVHAKEFKTDVELGVKLAQSGQPEVARLIFDGRYRRSEVPNLLPSGKDADFDLNTNQIIGEYLGDALMQSPTVMQAVREAGLSIYATDAAIGEALDGTRLEEALKMATGGVLEHNPGDGTGKFIAPIAGMSQQAFNQVLTGITDEDLQGALVGYSMEPEHVTADMLRNTLQFVSSGNGRYFLRYPGAGLVRNEDGTAFELDFNTLAPRVVARKNEQAATNAANDAAFEEQMRASSPYAPGGILSNFDEQTGLWKGPSQ